MLSKIFNKDFQKFIKQVNSFFEIKNHKLNGFKYLSFHHFLISLFLLLVIVPGWALDVQPFFYYQSFFDTAAIYKSPEEATDAYKAWEDNNNLTRGDSLYYIHVDGYAPIQGYPTANGMPAVYTYHFVRLVDCSNGCYGNIFSLNFACPPDFERRIEEIIPGQANFYYCHKRDPVTSADPPPQTCPKAPNPVYAETGLKKQYEADYIDPEGLLNFGRTWRSDKKQFINSTENSIVNNSQRMQTSGSCLKSHYQIFNTATSQYVNISFCFPYIATGTPEVQRLTPDGNRTIYTDTNGVLTAAADINDTLTRSTNAQGQTIWAAHNSDNSIETYAADGLIQSKQNPGGKTITYQYSDNTTVPLYAPRTGLLISITDPAGRMLRLSYNTNGNIETLVDPAAKLTRYTYDEASGNCPSSVQNGNCQRLTSVTYPDGSKKIYHYNEAGNIDPSLTNLDAYLTGITDENGTRLSTYQYDAQGRATSSGWGGNNYQLNYGTNQTTVTDPLGTARTYTYQEILGRKRPTNQSQPGGSGCGPAASNTGYDANGNIAYKIDFNGNRTNYTYDLVRNLETIRTEGLDANGNATNSTRSISTSWHATWRLPTQIIEKDAAGTALRQTDISYDSMGNKTSQSIKDIANNSTRTTSWSYTYNANVAGQIDQLIINGPRTDVPDITTIIYWLADANCTGNGTGYDKGCRGQIRQITNALGQTTQYTRYNPHGQIEQIIDANGTLTELSYDARQRLQETRVIGNSISRITHYQYDNVGQLTQITLPDNTHINYTYDNAHRLIQIRDTQGNQIQYTLDAMGNRTHETKTDPNGNLTQTLNRSIDTLNRIQQQTGINQ